MTRLFARVHSDANIRLALLISGVLLAPFAAGLLVLAVSPGMAGLPAMPDLQSLRGILGRMYQNLALAMLVGMLFTAVRSRNLRRTATVACLLAPFAVIVLIAADLIR